MSRKTQRSQTGKGFNQFRVIGGRWRGQRFDFPQVIAIRPTPDRVRETLFNWLQADIGDARCLDLFAGSGALGLEALSRGAVFVQFVDLEYAVCQNIGSHLQRLGAQNANVQSMSGQQYLQNVAEPFDIIFLDPPFHQNMIYPLCHDLDKKGWLSSRALIYLESEMAVDSEQLPSELWRIHRRKQAGQVHYTLIHYSTGQVSP